MTYYKSLQTGRIGPYSGWKWPQVGKWTPICNGDLVECYNGYHLCRRKDLVCWLNTEIYEAEVDGEVVECDYNILYRRARLVRRIGTWTKRSSRLFACDCAERVLRHWTDVYPDDGRPATAIAVARRHAMGEATSSDLADARDAAWTAAEHAAKYAAWGAERAAWTAAWTAAEHAAKYASWGAEHAAWTAVWDAHAAWTAAKAAAWASAGDAAWTAARDAARAAGDAAGDAERAWQTERLFWYLDGEVTE